MDVYRLKGIVARLFAVRPVSIRLVWESEEWDPVGGREAGWSVSEDESEDDEHRDKRRAKRRGSGGERRGEKEGWRRREMELADGTREVGFFVEGGEARVRVEVR